MDAGDRSGAAVMIAAYLSRHTVPDSLRPTIEDIAEMNRRRVELGRYDSSQVARLYGRLAYLQFARGDTAAVLTTYLQGGPYMAALDTLTHIRMLRYASYAYRVKGHTGLALTMISQSMRMAELAGGDTATADGGMGSPYKEEYELSAVCWRSLMDSGAVATVPARRDFDVLTFIIIAIGSGLFFAGVVFVIKARFIDSALGSHRGPLRHLL